MIPELLRLLLRNGGLDLLEQHVVFHFLHVLRARGFVFFWL